MNIYTPYTYLIGWSKLNWWYYGVRFAKDCHPSDLWVLYFTSSKQVSIIRDMYGEPDIIQIRRTFIDSNKARSWETKVLKRMNVINDSKWLNKTNNIAIEAMPGSMNPLYGKTHSFTTRLKMKQSHRNVSGINNPNFGKITTENTKLKIRNKLLGKKLTPETIAILSDTWIVTNPIGVSQTINNLSEHCRNNNLTMTLMCYVAKGKQTHHKGWKCIKSTH